MGPAMNNSSESPQRSSTSTRFRLETELATRSFYAFVKQAWHVVEPAAPFVDGIHIRAICEHLQAVTEGRIANLIINVPPGHAKSLLTAVLWPAWVWINHPETRWLFSSYREPLAIRDSVKCRRLIESNWYQGRWEDRYQLSGDQNQKNRFENTATGYRVVVPVGAGTGERGDHVVFDDPHSVDRVESDVMRKAAIDFWNGSMSTRLNDFATGHKVVIQQRVHEADLTGDLLLKGGYELLCLPAEFESDRRCSTSIGWSDSRQQPGELLWPEKVTRADLEGLKRSLGSYGYAGQYQQRPAPAEGGIFKRRWFRFWRPAYLDLPPVQVRTADGTVLSIEAVPIPAHFDTQIQSYDMAFKDGATSDYVVGQVWGALRADRYLLDQFRARLDMPETAEAVKNLSMKWPRAVTKLVEDKANGPAVIQSLQHALSGLTAVNPEGGKIARAHAASPQVESGNVYLPHPALEPWVNDLIEELAAFPNGRHDDQVDAMTQALNRLRNSNSVLFVPESQITVNPFKIPAEWAAVFAMAVSGYDTALLWGARNPGGTIYLYDEQVLPRADPAENARGIKSRGDWIPGVITYASLSGSTAERDGITQIYRERGLDLQTYTHGEEAGTYRLWQLLNSNELKVFASLSQFLNAYRTGDNQALMMLCCFALVVSGRQRMRPKPLPKLRFREFNYGGRANWMV
jgi:predicted phage terminase large subunit-like protein